MSQINDIKLGDIIEEISMGPFGSDIKTDNYVSSGVPIIRGGNLTSGRFNPDVGFVYLTNEKADSLGKANAYPDDVLITHRGTLGQVGIIPRGHFDRYVVSQSLLRMKINKHEAVPLYVYYFLKSPVGQYRLLANTSQTGVPAISQPVTSVRAIKIPLPPLPIQQRIAGILGALDDKIELNRKQNETLEAMARALFKAWFVDFEPVRAKQDGRWQRGQSLPGLPAHLYDLFPDQLVDSELGEIPQGWGVAVLGDFVNTVKGRSYKSEELADSQTALVTLKSFARGGGYRNDGLKPFTGTYKNDQIIEPGEIVIACTDVTQAAEIIGRTAIVRSTSRFQKLVASLDTLIVRPQSNKMTKSFIYHLGQTDAFIAHTYSHTTGTTVLHLGKEAIPTYRFVLPTLGLIQNFDVIALDLLVRSHSLEAEAENLVAIRDTLLPKLLSGELAV